MNKFTPQSRKPLPSPVSELGSSMEKAAIKAEVKRRFPGISKKK